MKRLLFFIIFIFYIGVLQASIIDDIKGIGEDLFFSIDDEVGFSFLKFSPYAYDMGRGGEVITDWKVNQSFYGNGNLSVFLLSYGDKMGYFSFEGGYKSIATGVYGKYLSYSSIEYRDSIPSSDIGEIYPSDVQLGLYVAWKTEDMIAKVNWFFVEEYIIEGYSTWGINFNLSWRLSDNKTMLFSINNLGPQTKVYQTSLYHVKLPFAYKLGFRYDIANIFNGNADFQGFIVKYSDAIAYLIASAEWRKDFISVYSGFRGSYENYYFSGGIGFDYKGWNLDYSIGVPINSVSMWHFLTLSFEI